MLGYSLSRHSSVTYSRPSMITIYLKLTYKQLKTSPEVIHIRNLVFQSGREKRNKKIKAHII